MLSMAEKIKTLMEQKSWSQAELARRSNISPQQISYYIKGQREPSPANIKKIAKAFNVESAIFIDDFESKQLFENSWDLMYELSNTNKVVKRPKTVDLSDDDVIMTFEGKPIPEEDKELIKRLLRGK